MLLFLKNIEKRTQHANNSQDLPASRTKRTQGRNIPFGGTPHSDKKARLSAGGETPPSPSLLSPQGGPYIWPCLFSYVSACLPSKGSPDPVAPRDKIGVKGSPEWDISSLRAFGPGGGQIFRVVRSTSPKQGLWREVWSQGRKRVAFRTCLDPLGRAGACTPAQF